MKNLLLLFSMTIFASCSSSDDINSELEENQNNTEEDVLLLSKMIEKDEIYNDNVYHNFIYENGLLTKTTVSTFGNDYSIFEYDEDGKINNVKRYGINYSADKEQLWEEITIEREGNQIIRHSLNEGVLITYTLNSDDQVIKRECETCETLIFEYRDRKISKQTVISNDGSFAGENSYEYDSGKNPINILFKEFRFLENNKTNFLDNTMEFYLTNLVTKEYDEDGNVKFSATYEKNEFDYPTTAYWQAPMKGESGTIKFEYIQKTD